MVFYSAISGNNSNLGLDSNYRATSYNSDLNDINTTSFYYANTNATNKPINANGFVTTYVLDNNYKKQLFYHVTENSQYIRTKINGVWDNWRRFGDAIPINVTGYVATNVNWTVSDLSYTFPAKSIVSVTAFSSYNYIAPIGVAITQGNSLPWNNDFAEIGVRNNSGVDRQNYPVCHYCRYIDTAVTVYVWGVYEGTHSSNTTVYLSGFYIPLI